jgi:DNA-binding GntR family transcriptional regulator
MPVRTQDGLAVLNVHDRLRRAILDGDIAAGSVMTQEALTERFASGRTPLREALRMLQREGLVVSEPGRRLRIASLSAGDAEEIYTMRIALEAVAVRITVPQLGSNDVAEMEGLMAQMDHYMKTNDTVGLRAPHRAFHHRLVEGAGPRVSATIGELFDHSDRYRRHFGALGRWKDRRGEHRSILDAAASGNGDSAAEFLVRHYLHTVRLVFAQLEPGHNLSRIREAVATVAPGASSAL